MLESYNISLSFSALKNYGVYGDYMKIGRAVSMFLVASIKYVIASGRKGRINVSVRQSGKRVRIMIADNGIGLSGKVFERIHSDGVVPSGLDCFKELSGVGISDAVRWIEESGGEVYMTNDESKGSATQIFLPLCKESYLREEHLLPDIESAVASIFSVLTENEPE